MLLGSRAKDALVDCSTTPVSFLVACARRLTSPEREGVENERIYIVIFSETHCLCGVQPSLLSREGYEKAEKKALKATACFAKKIGVEDGASPNVPLARDLTQAISHV